MQKFGKLPKDVFAPQLQRMKEKRLTEIDGKEISITKLGEYGKVTSRGNLPQKQPANRARANNSAPCIPNRG